MDKIFFDKEVETALTALRNGQVILYPTDTIWGLGCDATNAHAVQRIYQIKQRQDTKSLIILMADQREVLKYVATPDLAVFNFLEEQTRPTTIIFDNAVGLPDNLIAADGSIAIRIVQDAFCRHLCIRLQKPLVSTSANISGQPPPASFAAISQDIKNSVDHIVQWRQHDETKGLPSQIIKWERDGTYKTLRS